MKRLFAFLSILVVCVTGLVAQQTTKITASKKNVGFIEKIERALESRKLDSKSVMDAIGQDDTQRLRYIFELRPDLVNATGGVMDIPLMCYVMERPPKAKIELLSIFLQHGFEKMGYPCQGMRLIVKFGTYISWPRASEVLTKNPDFCRIFKKTSHTKGMHILVDKFVDELAGQSCLWEIMQEYPEMVGGASSYDNNITDIRTVKPIVEYKLRHKKDLHGINFPRLMVKAWFSSGDRSLLDPFRPKWVTTQLWDILIEHARQDINSFAYAVLPELIVGHENVIPTYNYTLTKKGAIEDPVDKQDYAALLGQYAILTHDREQVKQKAEQEKQAKEEKAWVEKFGGNEKLAAQFKNVKDRGVYFYPEGASISFQAKHPRAQSVSQEFIVPIVVTAQKICTYDWSYVGIEVYNVQGTKIWSHDQETWSCNIIVQPKDKKNERLNLYI